MLTGEQLDIALDSIRGVRPIEELLKGDKGNLVSPPQLSDTEFECPECGSHYFGTGNCGSAFDKWIGHCHGSGCKFTWPRIDDEKYFKQRASQGNGGRDDQ